MYDKVVYISGPYRAGTIVQIEANITAAENEAIYCWGQGFAVLCPHKNSRDFERIFKEDSVLLPGDEELVSRCDIIVMLPGWRQSVGSRREHARAESDGKIILLKKETAPHVYRISVSHNLTFDITISKGKFFTFPKGNELSWRELPERIKRGAE